MNVEIKLQTPARHLLTLIYQQGQVDLGVLKGLNEAGQLALLPLQQHEEYMQCLRHCIGYNSPAQDAFLATLRMAREEGPSPSV